MNKPPLAPEAVIESNVRETLLHLRRHICDYGPEDFLVKRSKAESLFQFHDSGLPVAQEALEVSGAP